MSRLQETISRQYKTRWITPDLLADTYILSGSIKLLTCFDSRALNVSAALERMKRTLTSHHILIFSFICALQQTAGLAAHLPARADVSLRGPRVRDLDLRKLISYRPNFLHLIGFLSALLVKIRCFARSDCVAVAEVISDPMTLVETQMLHKNGCRPDCTVSL